MDERVLLEANRGVLVLTTRRVRLAQTSFGHASVVSITLDSIASCGLVTLTYPALLAVAFVSAIMGLGFLVLAHEKDAFYFAIGMFFLLSALVWILVFLVTRRGVLELASAGAKIQMDAKGLGRDALMEFIDTLERAKLSN